MIGCFLLKSTLGIIVNFSPEDLLTLNQRTRHFLTSFYTDGSSRRVWYPSELWKCFTCLSPHIVCWQNEWQGQVCWTDLSGFTVLDALFDVRELLRRRILGCFRVSDKVSHLFVCYLCVSVAAVDGYHIWWCTKLGSVSQHEETNHWATTDMWQRFWKEKRVIHSFNFWRWWRYARWWKERVADKTSDILYCMSTTVQLMKEKINLHKFQ